MFPCSGFSYPCQSVHGSDDLIERNLVVARLAHGNSAGIDRFHGPHGIAFDAGNLNQPFDRVAGHAEVGSRARARS